MTFDYEIIKSLAVVGSAIGGIVLAACKSIFITKKDFKDFELKFDRKIYDDKSQPLYVLVNEYETYKENIERRHDTKTRATINKIEDIRKEIMSELKSNKSEMTNLSIKVEKYIASNDSTKDNLVKELSKFLESVRESRR